MSGRINALFINKSLFLAGAEQLNQMRTTSTMETFEPASRIHKYFCVHVQFLLLLAYNDKSIDVSNRLICSGSVESQFTFGVSDSNE